MSDRTCGKCGKAILSGVPIEVRLADNDDPFSPEWEEFVKCFTGYENPNQMKFLLLLQKHRPYVWEEYTNESDRTNIEFDVYLKNHWPSKIELREAFKYTAKMFKQDYLKPRER